MEVVKMEIVGGAVVTVDAADYPLVASGIWYLGHSDSSRSVRYAARLGMSMHRLIMGLEQYDPRQVDHINGDGLDNRRCNLRICTRQQNQWNRGPRRGSATGLKGVTPDGKRFAARIKINGKSIRLGKYATPEEAHRVYCEKLLSVAGEFARTDWHDDSIRLVKPWKSDPEEDHDYTVSPIECGAPGEI